MRVAVIGGTGLVGRHLIDELAARGHTTIAIARRSVAGWHQGFAAADATRPHALERLLADQDAVVFAAGSLRQTRGQAFHDIYVSAIRNLVQACRTHHIRRVILVSSLGARPTSRSSFHRAKFAGEDLASRSLLDVTVLRPSIIFGVDDDFVNPLARFLRRMPVAPLPGRGSARLAPIAAADVARAIAQALDRPDTVGAAYDLPGPESLSIAEIYDRVMQSLGTHRPKVSVPYLFIEPLTYLFGSSPGMPFTFDQLAILEEELETQRDPGPACDALALSLQWFTPEAIQCALT